MPRFFVPVLVVLSLLFGAPIAKCQVMVGNTVVDTSSVIQGLDTPWELVWGPDNRIWITERYGRISALDPETGVHTELAVLPDVSEDSEAGLLGMTLHPDFPNTPHVFAVYVYFQGFTLLERVSRFTWDSSNDTLLAELILLDNIPAEFIHSGSRLMALPDNTLLITTGDAADGSLAQDSTSLAGKVLRMNFDATIPVDNPFPGSYVYTLGHRNAQGITSVNGTVILSEHGPNSDDEINRLEIARNYGWPDVAGYCNGPTEMVFCSANNVVEPLTAWTPTLAVAGITYYNPVLQTGSYAIPEWQGKLLMTTLKNSAVWSMGVNAPADTLSDITEHFPDFWGRLRCICWAPDGRVFIGTSNQDGRGTPVPGDDRIVEFRGPQFVGNQEAVSIARRPVLFPNPANGQFTLAYSAEWIGGQAQVLNTAGQVVRSFGIEDANYLVVSTQGMSAGIYLLQISRGVQSVSLRFAVE